MHRIDQVTAVSTLPTPAAAGTPGYFTEGNPATGTPATVLDADWANNIQEELISILTAAGITPSKTLNNQVITALTNGSLFRTKLSANTTYHVSTTGNDSTGNGTSGAPWATLQHADNYIKDNLDLNGYTVTVNVADGTYAGFYSSGAYVGQTGSIASPSVVYVGDTTTPANCIITSSTGNAVQASLGARLGLSGFRFSTTGGGANCVTATDGGVITIVGLVDYNACVQSHKYAAGAGAVVFDDIPAYTISGGAQCHAASTIVGEILNLQPATVTLTGTPAFSTSFAQSSALGILQQAGNTYTGSATGARYSVTSNGVIQTNGGGANYFPGNSAGSTATGGQYV